VKAKNMVLGTIVMVAVLAGACTAALGSPKQTTIAASYEEFMEKKVISKEVTIPQGSKLVIELGSNPSTGFNWSKASVADPAVLEEIDSKYVEPAGQVVGAAGTQVWTFTASKEGTTRVEMQYGRHWDGGEKTECTFEIVVVVQ
jgi:inhibitor of cysteine peptidase